MGKEKISVGIHRYLESYMSIILENTHAHNIRTNKRI